MSRQRVKIDTVKAFSLMIPAFWIICLLTVFLVRLLHTIDAGDEVQNLTMAYRLTLGQRPWVEIWELFQSGNSFAAPFINIYTAITGSTDGLILFSRITYFAMNIGLGTLFYCTMKEYFSHDIVLPAAVLIVCYAPFSLYYIWYDTMGLYFLLLGELLLLKGTKTEKRREIWLFFAGVSFAFMSYAYPSYIVIAVSFLLYSAFSGVKNGWRWSMFLPLCAGAGSIFCIFVGYLLYNGLSNTIFLKSDVLAYIFESHSAKTGIGRKILHLFSQPAKRMLLLVIPTIILFFIYVRSIVKDSRSLKLIVIVGIITLPIFGFWNHGSLATIYYLFYIFCWIPFICFYIKRDDIKCFMRLFWVPGLLAYILVGFTSNNGGLKSPLGVFSGAVVGVLLIGTCLEQLLKKRYKVQIILFIIVAAEVFLFCLNTFNKGSITESNQYIDSGIFRGLYGTEEDLQFSEGEKMIQSVMTENDRTLLVTSSKLLPVYLYTDLTPATFFFSWIPYLMKPDHDDWTPTILYWEKVSDRPDIIVCKNDEEKDDFMTELLEHYYKEVASGAGMEIYREKCDEKETD